MTFRIYETEEIDKILKIKNEGGILYLIERTDTNEYAYSKAKPDSFRTNSPNFGMVDVLWTKEINEFHLYTGMFLTRQDAEKYSNLTEDGCRFCGNGSKKIPTVITEHEFIT